MLINNVASHSWFLLFVGWLIDLVMINRIILLFFILLAAKIIELEDVAEKSELLAIILVIGFISAPIYLMFKFLQEILTLKKEIQSTLKDKSKKT